MTALDQHDRVRHVVHLGVGARTSSSSAHATAVPEAEVRVEPTAHGGDAWTCWPDAWPDAWLDAAQAIAEAPGAERPPEEVV